MSGLNQISIIGNLGADPILRTTNNNNQVCNLRVAVNEGTVDNPVTTWFSVTVWNEMAVQAASLKKGTQVYISGRVNMKTWDREVVAPNSNEVFTVKSDSFEIVADTVLTTTDSNTLVADVSSMPAELNEITAN